MNKTSLIVRRLALVLVSGIALTACSWPTSGTGTLVLDVPAVGPASELTFTVGDPEHGVCQVVAVLSQGAVRRELELRRIVATGPDAKKPASVKLATRADSWPASGFGEGEAVLEADIVNCSVFRGKTHAEAKIAFDYTPPRVSLTSGQHYISQGGADVATYSAGPDAVSSGVRVGPNEFRGYPKPGEGEGTGECFAFFVFSYNLPADTPVEVYARDAAGNEGKAILEPARFFPKQFRHREIAIDDDFIRVKVAAVIANTPGMKGSGDFLGDFLNVNRDLRRKNAAFIKEVAARSEPSFLWKDAFEPLADASIEAAFADARDYYYGESKVDEQVHLGFDLAVTERHPVIAAAAGRVLYSGYLGIYGNTVILDHGYGLTSLYAHMSASGVKEGETVAKGGDIGRSGATGLAGGDHVHFSLLIQGVETNPIEFWDPHWIKDHVYLRLDNKVFGKL